MDWTFLGAVILAALLSYGVGFWFGHASVEPKVIRVTESGFGRYAAFTADGVQVVGTESSNPSTSWKLLLDDYGDSREDLKADGFKVKRVD